MTAAPLPLFRRGRWYESWDTAAVGHTARRLCLAPEIMLRDDLRRVAARGATLAPVPLAHRQVILSRAVRAFRDATLTVDGSPAQHPADFAAALHEIAGLPAALVDRWTGMLVDEVDALRAGRVDDGRILVWLPGNTFTCLAAVAEAVLRGGHVVVRPSRREPLSAARFTAALLDAGWPPERISFYGTTTAALGPLVSTTDRQIVYGGPSVVPVLPTGTSSTVDLRGPGRGCAIVDADTDPTLVTDWLAGLVAADSGRFCTNVRTIACLGAAEPIAARLAAALDAVTLVPPDPRLPVAAVPPATATTLAGAVTGGLTAGDRIVTRRPMVVTHGESTFLVPTLVLLRWSSEHPLLARELPFPFAAAVGVTPAQADALTRRSLFVHRCGDAAAAPVGDRNRPGPTKGTP